MSIISQSKLVHYNEYIGKVLQNNEFVRILTALFCCWGGLVIVDSHNSDKPSQGFTFSFAIK